jgi:limonene-1,2-epoxide hydrolase
VEDLVSQDAVSVVKNFAARWDAKDSDGVLGYLTDDCVCNNTPLKEIVGKAAIGAYMEGVFKAVDTTKCNWKSMVPGDNGQVLCEVEKLMTEGGTKVPLQTMVAFTVRDGKIARWNSYFDKSKLQQLGKLSQVLAAHS